MVGVSVLNVSLLIGKIKNSRKKHVGFQKTNRDPSPSGKAFVQ